MSPVSLRFILAQLSLWREVQQVPALSSTLAEALNSMGARLHTIFPISKHSRLYSMSRYSYCPHSPLPPSPTEHPPLWS